MNMNLLTFILFSLLFSCNSRSLSPADDSPIAPPPEALTSESSLAIIEDGDSIFEPGVFEAGCHYKTSLSDHAPVIYKDFATWNIASPASHWLIIPDAQIPTNTFFNHKFFTDSQGHLLDKEGKKVGFNDTSEVILVAPSGKKKGYAIISTLYVERIRKVAQAIKNFFQNRKDLQYMVLQEIPRPSDKSNAGENIHEELKKALQSNSPSEPDLAITFFKPSPQGLPPVEEMPAPELSTLKKRHSWVDVAIVSKKDINLTQEIVDHHNRFVPFCKPEEKTCFISAHMPYTATDADLADRCKLLNAQVLRLFNQGYTHIKMAGDFNTDAKRIALVCKDTLTLPNATVSIHTSKESKGNSCSTNMGNMAHQNIDLFIEFKAR